MSRLASIKLSTLDLAPIRDDGDAAQALHNSLALARHVESLGFERFWVAEHHNMDGIASSATSVLLGYLAAGTSRIRLGAGGVMLPNHAPLVIAEQFGTLATLYPLSLIHISCKTERRWPLSFEEGGQRRFFLRRRKARG